MAPILLVVRIGEVAAQKIRDRAGDEEVLLLEA